MNRYLIYLLLFTNAMMLSCDKKISDNKYTSSRNAEWLADVAWKVRLDDMYRISVLCAWAAIKFDPSYADPYFSLGLAYNRLRKPDNALFYFNKYLALKPNDSLYGDSNKGIYAEMAIAYMLKGQNSIASANFKKFLNSGSSLAIERKDKMSLIIRDLDANPNKKLDPFAYEPWQEKGKGVRSKY